jgi:DNA-binding CsgD family transcriptional regulator
MPVPRSSRLVGRETEQRQLGDAAARARQGCPVAVLIEGEAGIGKSRLLAECIEDEVGPDDVVVVGHGVELLGGELPFGVVTDALRDLVRRQGIDTVRAAGEWVAPALGTMVPGLARGRVPPPDRARIFDAFATLLTQLSRDRLVWLVVEDLHWVDTSSRDLVGYLVRVVGEPCRLLITCTLRTEAGHLSTGLASFVDEFVRSPATQRIGLPRLSRGQMADQVAGLLQEKPAPQLLDRVVALSDGVPFLAEELVAARLDVRGPVPASVGALMLTRFGWLSPPAQRMVQAASLGEGHLRHRLLGPVCELTPDQLMSAVAEAVRSNVLVVTEDGDGYRFHHALLQQAVADTTLPGDRLLWHRRWAEQLENDPAPSDGSFSLIAAAHHWSQTDDWVRAFDSARSVARLAHDLAASAEQATLSSRVLDLWEKVPDAAARAGCDRDDVLDEALQARDWAGEYAEALELIDRELRRVDPATFDPVRLLYLQLRRGFFADGLGRTEEERPSIDVDAAIHMLREAPPGRLFVRAVSEMVWDWFPTAHPDIDAQLVARALEVAQHVGTARAQLWMRINHTQYLYKLGQAAQAADLTLGMLPQVREEFPTIDVSVVESNCAAYLCLLGRYQEAADLGRQALRRVGHPELARWVWVHATENLCSALFELGEWDEAEALLTPARDLDFVGHGAMWLELRAGEIHCHRGDTTAARVCMVSAESKLPVTSRGFEGQARSWLRRLSAQIAATDGDFSTASRHVGPLVRVAEGESRDPYQWRSLLLAVRIESDRTSQSSRHRRDKSASAARQRLEQIRQLSSEIQTLGAPRPAWKAQFEAELSRLEGHSDLCLWQAAADAWADTGQIHDHAWALARIAECQIAAADRTGAVDSLTRARQIGAKLRAAPLLEAIEDIARRARLDLHIVDQPKARKPQRHGLTTRELEVLHLIANGRTNDQIASELFIAPKTASVHVSHILTKLDVGSRSEATTVAHRLHLLGNGDGT